MEIQYIGHILYLSSYRLYYLPSKLNKSTPIDISFQIMEGRTFRSQYNYIDSNLIDFLYLIK